MNFTYQDNQAGLEYSEFSQSADGKQQQQLIWSAITPHLPYIAAAKLLDCGCGMGWLSHRLKSKFNHVEGCDISDMLLAQAREFFPEIKFTKCDLSQPLPYANDFFDCVVAALTLHNLDEQKTAYENLYKITKPDGRLVVISPNPYYAYPVGQWKRGLLGRLPWQRPKLMLNEYFKFLDKKQHRWSGKNIPLRFTPLPEQINAGLSAGFTLKSFSDLKSPQDSKDYNFDYRLFRFPLLILMVFEKI